MRRTAAIVALGCAVAAFAAQTSGTGLLGAFSSALKQANTLSASYTYRQIGSGDVDSYSVAFKKSNLARIDTPSQLIVADGKEITTYNKGEKTYSKKPETDAEVQALLDGDQLDLFKPFFGGELNAASAKSLGQKVRKGEPMNVVQTTQQGQRTVTYYLGSDNLAHAAQFETKLPGDAMGLLDTKSFQINGNLPADAFTFVAPDGSKQVSLDELNAAKWLTNLHEAISLARKTHKKIFVDFMATWCGPCKMLERECFGTQQFRDMSKKLVFLRIDVDAQKDVAQMYNIEAMPTQMVLDENGNTLSTRVGYSNASAFFGWLKSSS